MLRMQKRQEEQVRELYLDHYSWDMPYKMSTAGLNPSRDKSQDKSSQGGEVEKEKKKKKGEKAKKGKGKGSKAQEEVPLTREQQR